MKICKVPNCEGKVLAKGYCSKHYQQYKKYGEELAPPKQTICKVDGCEGKHKAKGYCDKHYLQYLRHGEILERTRFNSNEIVEYESHAEIVLYDKDCEEIARVLIDLEDIDRCKNYKWYLNSFGYVYNNKVGLLHRFIMNPKDDEIIDHINHNKLNNKRCNLRICSQQQNLMNASKRKNCSSKFKGVFWNKYDNRWRASIVINNRNKYIGNYLNEIEAAEAYDRASIKYFKEYAFTNFPIENYIDDILELGLNPSDFNIDNKEGAE